MGLRINGTGYHAHAYSTYEDFASIDPVDHDGEDNYAGWDIALSETWGPPYDATSKLWDMTHGLSGSWCSEEADAAAVKNMEGMKVEDFGCVYRGAHCAARRGHLPAAYRKAPDGRHELGRVGLQVWVHGVRPAARESSPHALATVYTAALAIAALEELRQPQRWGDLAGIAVGAVLGSACLFCWHSWPS